MGGCTGLLLAPIFGAVHQIWCILWKCTYSEPIFQNNRKLENWIKSVQPYLTWIYMKKCTYLAPISNPAYFVVNLLRFCTYLKKYSLHMFLFWLSNNLGAALIYFPCFRLSGYILTKWKICPFSGNLFDEKYLISINLRTIKYTICIRKQAKSLRFASLLLFSIKRVCLLI